MFVRLPPNSNHADEMGGQEEMVRVLHRSLDICAGASTVKLEQNCIQPESRQQKCFTETWELLFLCFLPRPHKVAQHPKEAY